MVAVSPLAAFSTSLLVFFADKSSLVVALARAFIVSQLISLRARRSSIS